MGLTKTSTSIDIGGLTAGNGWQTDPPVDAATAISVAANLTVMLSTAPTSGTLDFKIVGALNFAGTKGEYVAQTSVDAASLGIGAFSFTLSGDVTAYPYVVIGVTNNLDVDTFATTLEYSITTVT